LGGGQKKFPSDTGGEREKEPGKRSPESEGVMGQRKEKNKKFGKKKNTITIGNLNCLLGERQGGVKDGFREKNGKKKKKGVPSTLS